MITRHRMFWIVIVILGLSACSQGPSESDIQTAIAGTQDADPEVLDTPSPEPSATSISLSQIFVDDVLLVDGDLSSDHRMNVITDELPGLKFFNLLRALPQADRIIAYQVENTEADLNEWMVIQVFKSSSDAESAYRQMSTSEELEEPEEVDVGFGSAVISERPYFSYLWKRLVYRNCNMVVYLSTTADVVNYAKRLNSRLEPLLCQEVVR